MNLFIELWKHGRLAEKRHPMYDKNRFAKFFIYLGIAFWIGYLLFFAILFATALSNESVEPYHLINSGLFVFLILDFLMRIPFQKNPTQEMKPYLLLPIRRKQLIDMVLIRSGLSSFNAFWLFFFVPFACLSVARFYGFTGVLTYSLGIWLLMVANNYWYLLCRTLMDERPWWVALPVSVYGLLIATLFLPDKSPLFNLFLNLGESYITAHPLSFILTIAIIILLWNMNYRVLQRVMYNELNKVDDTTVQVKTLSEYRFLDRYGQLGEYIRLELKLILRNKICRRQLYMALAATAMFSLILGFTNTYTGMMKTFFITYNFVLIAIMFLGSLMSYEGNYIDGLMSRKESLYTLLCAKYILYSLAQLIPFVMMIPGMISGNIQTIDCIAWLLFVPGPVYFILFQLAVYNQKSIPLNVKVISGQNMGSGLQNLVTAGSFFIPFFSYALLILVVGETYVAWTLIAIGVIFIAASPLWIKHVYRRFMKRRYKNIEGFHNSRTKI